MHHYNFYRPYSATAHLPPATRLVFFGVQGVEKLQLASNSKKKRMQNIHKKPEPFFYHMMLGAFIALSLLHLLTGYADNGDFLRSAGFLFEKPYNFSTMWPPAESGEWKRRFFSEWHDKWVFLKNWPSTENFFSISSYKPYLLSQAYLSTLINNESSHYSIISGSILSRLILYTAFIIIAHHLGHQISNIAKWIFTTLFGLIIIDSSWIAFLNSLYEEQIAIIFLPILGFLILKITQSKSTKTGFWILLCATFIGTAKTAYFYLPTLSFLFLTPFFSSKKSLIRLILIAILLQSTSLLPVYFGKHGKTNSYHAVYFGALKALPSTESSSIKSIGGKPVLHDCIGVSAFSPIGRECMEAANASYTDIVKLIANHPSIGFTMISKLLEEGRSTRLEYLGKGIKNSPNFSENSVFNIWPKLFSKGLNYFALLILPLASLLLASRKSFLNKNEKQVLFVGIFFATFGFSQYIASLGDGYYEITKHLAAGNYALALSLAFIIASIISRTHRLCFEAKIRIGKGLFATTHNQSPKTLSVGPATS